MISEEILRKSAAEADQAIRDSLPAPADCKHEFSPLFQRKMRRTFRKAKHPVIYKLPKYVACFILAVALASSTWLAVDAKSRAAFFAWVREQYETYVEYRFVGDAPQENDVSKYEIKWLPEGFSLKKAEVLGGGTYLTYTNNSGQRIILSYLQGDDSKSMFLASDYIDIQTVQFGDIKADFYQAGQESSDNGLVWVLEEEKLCFCITAPFPKDTMIKLAESVSKK